jgi:hypothetical protein
MRKFKVLRTTALVMGFILVTFGCATSKSRQYNADTGLKAEAVPEGISLTFDYIPPETTRLFITFQNWDETANPVDTHEITSSYSDIRGSSLEQVKQTGEIIFPFVKAGQIYHISAFFQNDSFQPVEGMPECITTECVPYSGIYFNGNIALNLNEDYTGVTLSGEPQFSEDVVFSARKYSYNATITINENKSLGIGGNTDNQSADGLTWIFEPEMTEQLRQENALKNGDYLAYVTASCNIIYDNLSWDVEIAKSRGFSYSFQTRKPDREELLTLAKEVAALFDYYDEISPSIPNMVTGPSETGGQCGDYALAFVNRWNETHPNKAALVIQQQGLNGFPDGLYEVTGKDERNLPFLENRTTSLLYIWDGIKGWDIPNLEDIKSG